MILLQKKDFEKSDYLDCVIYLRFWTQSREKAYRLGCLIKIKMKENFILACSINVSSVEFFPSG